MLTPRPVVNNKIKTTTFYSIFGEERINYWLNLSDRFD